ncbi:helix-turn-helix domain-containing protein [uncultured Jannaschia sp.]|uniref:helix-turn-helix domain-containing protein n=1 Tax=uncultured Jannaschia sp. TaxID=293347 RepID=UPI002631E9D8|nr:helix-turn-helix domain-containing protein [uncultured Jannaschia sp.]
MTQLPAATPRRQQASACLPQTISGPIDRWYALDLVRQNRCDLGLNDRDIAVLQAHLSVLPKGPLDPRRLNVSYAGKPEISRRSNHVQERTITRCETRLEEAGLVQRRRSANGRRFPVRIAGNIVDAFGIDLAPLLNCLPELEAMSNAHIVREEKQRYLRTRISNAAAALARHARRAAQICASSLEGLVRTGRNLARRTAVSREDVEDYEGRVDQLLATPDPSPEAAPEDLAAGSTKEDSASENALTPLKLAPDGGPSCHDTASARRVLPDRRADDAGQPVRHIEPRKKEDNRPSLQMEQLDPRQIVALWADLKALPDYHPAPPRDGHALAQMVLEFSGFLDLDRRLMIDTCAQLGWPNALRVLDYMTRRFASIKSPTAYLKMMLEKYRSGKAIAAGAVRMNRPLIRG